MRFRLTFILGFGVGYYLGAKAGRERYEQMRRWLERAGDSQLLDKVRASLDLAIERLRESVDHGERQGSFELEGISRN